MNFDEFFQSVCTALQNAGQVSEVSRQFSAVATDVERIELALRIPQVAVPLQKLTHAYKQNKNEETKKSAEASAAFRLRGNDAYQHGQNDRALELYTLSVLHAPHPSPSSESQREELVLNSTVPSVLSLYPELSLAYANRSAVLFQLGQYTQALRDIDLALRYGYPQNNRYKLLERRAKCYQKTGNLEKAVTNFERAQESLRESDLNEEKKIRYEKQLSQQVGDCRIGAEGHSSGFAKKENGNEPRNDVKLPEPNARIPCASAAVEIAFTTDRGRHVVAARDIEPGERLVCELPYASILLPEYASSHCANCHRRCSVPLPCYFSNNVRFCSPGCQNEQDVLALSLKTDMWPFLHSSDIGKNALLAFQIILQTGLEYFIRFDSTNSRIVLNQLGEQEELLRGFNEKGLYDSSDYRTIYNLIANTESRSVADLFKRSLMAIYMLKVLDLGSFFGSVSSANVEWSTPTPMLVTVGSFLLLHLQNLPCNAHDISELIVPKSSLSESYIQDTGCGAYATLSLINHSCDPNVVRHYVGKQAIVTAITPIRKGAEILDNYGYHYAVHPYAERQVSLRQQYYFQCSCPACAYKWPEYARIPTQILFLCSPDCAATAGSHPTTTRTPDLCAKCGRKTASSTEYGHSTQEYHKALEQLLQWKPSCNPGKILETEPLKRLFCRHVSFLHRHVAKPVREFNDAQEALKQVLAMECSVHIT